MMAVNIANGLAEVGIESHICTTRLEGTLKSKIDINVGYLFLNKKKIIDFDALNKLYKYIKENNIKIIHAHSSSYFMAFLMKIVHPSINIIWHNHFGDIANSPIWKINFLKFASFKFKHIIAVNTALNEWSQKHLNSKNNSYLPNFASFNSNAIKTTVLYGVSGKRILCLANLRPEKDHLNLLKAFKNLHHIYSDWSLHLVGTDLKDKYALEIKEYITFNKLGNHVFLYGSCNDTAYVLKQATLGVLASKSEGLPVALLEYGLAKLPVVVTDVGECASVVTHERSGLVVSPNNEEALATGLDTFMKNENLRILLGSTLYETIQMKYSKSIFMHTLIEIYNLD